MKINYVANNGEKRQGVITKNIIGHELVEIVFEYHLGQKRNQSENYFRSLQEIRMELEIEGIAILCNGSSVDVYPSGMMTDMGAGDKAYRLIDGKHASIKDVVDIFQYDETQYKKGTVSEQEKFYDTWRRSKRRRSTLIKPVYTIESIVNKDQHSFIFFWGHQPTKDGSVSKSCLSQWWPCIFEKDGVEYISAEQWMMAEKARAFLDKETLSEILKSKSPKKAKDLGRRVSNFNEDVWKLKSYSIVLEGNLLKFRQNHELKDYLIGTNNAILVEASPYDKIWGIGMKEEDEGIENPENWQGQNLLGFALMEVRERLNEGNHPA